MTNLEVNSVEKPEKVSVIADLSKPSSQSSNVDVAAPNANVEEEKDITPAEKSLLQKKIRRGLVETKNSLDIQRKNPNSPLYSIKSFAALHL